VIVGEVTAALVVAFLLEVVMPGDRAAGWPLRRVLTDNGKEFTGGLSRRVPRGGFGTCERNRGTRGPTGLSSGCRGRFCMNSALHFGDSTSPAWRPYAVRVVK